MLIGPLLGPLTGILGLVGLILVLVAFHGLADYYDDSRIFNNVVYGTLAVIVGAVIAIVVIVIAAFGFLLALGFNPSNWMSWNAIQTFNWSTFTNWSALIPYIFVILGALLTLFVFVVVGAIFLKRSYDATYEKSHVHMFATTGLLTLVGAVLTIIIIGLILLWISEILLIVAFSRLKE
jgi:uncharacterized membrane protein